MFSSLPQNMDVSGDDSVRGNRSIPVEILEKVLLATLYQDGSFSPRIRHEDLAGTDPDIASAKRIFKFAFLLVNRQVNAVVRRVLWRYLDIRSEEELADIVATGGDSECKLTWRVDLRIRDAYASSLAVRLLEKMKNLQIFVLANPSGTSHQVSRARPDNIVDALCRFNVKLVRLHFQSLNEEPTVGMVKRILSALAKLATLHLDSLYHPAQGDDDNESSIISAHTNLTTLSIGGILAQPEQHQGMARAGVFLGSCLQHHILPALNVLYVLQAVPGLNRFLQRYGPQVRQLGLPTTIASRIEEDAGHLMEHCPNLDHLTLVSGERWPATPSGVLIPHIKLRRITFLFISRPMATANVPGLQRTINAILATHYPQLSAVEVVCDDPDTLESLTESTKEATEALRMSGIMTHMYIIKR